MLNRVPARLALARPPGRGREGQELQPPLLRATLPRVAAPVRSSFGISSATLDTAQRGGGVALRSHNFDLRADGGRELAARNWLGEKIADPKTHAFCTRFDVVPRGDKNDRNLG